MVFVVANAMMLAIHLLFSWLILHLNLIYKPVAILFVSLLAIYLIYKDYKTKAHGAFVRLAYVAIILVMATFWIVGSPANPSICLYTGECVF